MADSLAVQMATAAKAKRDSNNASDQTKIEAAINQLATAAWVEANAGRSYLQISQSVPAQKAFYDAITTKKGIVYLASFGFRLEQMNGVANIWWEAPETIQQEAEAILRPKPIEVFPKPGDPQTPANPDPETPVKVETPMLPGAGEEATTLIKK